MQPKIKITPEDEDDDDFGPDGNDELLIID